MTFYQNPFFWAMIGMFCLVGGGVIVSRKSGYSVLYGAVIVTVFVLARGVLVLPFCVQPRFEANGWHLFVGGLIFVIGLVFSLPALAIKPLTAPNEQMKLVTTGFYALVRNPIYLGEVLWCLGWSIMFRSIIGLALVPLWWTALLLHTLVEEESLERALGEKYLVYKRKVRGRIIPGLPI
ncbi:MAG: isoprenylcysteine carboxylmethyltransferase family protein [candidate division WOR-3 bacterium]|nr:MAG: isoprenylcysteine carboxylmethyltransferase family protein [candidate division WOR-3 bacterium]